MPELRFGLGMEAGYHLGVNRYLDGTVILCTFRLFRPWADRRKGPWDCIGRDHYLRLGRAFLATSAGKTSSAVMIRTGRSFPAS